MNTNAVAIVGMACRYPDATSPEELWQNVIARRRAFRRIPECRLAPSYFGSRDDPDLAYVTHAGVLRDWEFDRARFSVPGRTYRVVDHTHWLALETTAAALADSGHPGGEGLTRARVGVIFGNSLAGEFSRAATLRVRWPFVASCASSAMQDLGLPTELSVRIVKKIEEMVKGRFPVPDDDTLAGALSNTIAGRICNHFDFHGTGYTVDGACSSSLIAVMTACRALRCGELDYALVGGVDMSLDPFELVGFSRLGALATDEMRVYDAHPSGFLPGEGCGVVALARAKYADRTGMRTYAHIVGWGSSSDGSGGLTRPSRAGHVLAINRACEMAGIPPIALTLIEGHGTGTAVGDRIELEALAQLHAHAAQPAALGSIKANIGHTKAAAGIAGLIKATIATYHRVLPPTTGCVEPHPLLAGPHSGVRVLAAPEPWPDPTAHAGVSALGFGGINVHVVLTGTDASPTPGLTDVVRQWSFDCGPMEIMFIGSSTPTVLAERLAALATTAPGLSYAEVRDIAVTQWRQGDDHQARYRAALVASTPQELALAAEHATRAIANWDGSLLFDKRFGYGLGSAQPARIGLLLPGQAAPTRLALDWWAERFPIPEATQACVDSMSVAGTDVAQPAIVRQSLAGLAWLSQVGCTPVAAVGHSLGEITAMHWAGAFSAEVAMDLATLRGHIMAVYGQPDTTMATLLAAPEVASELINGTNAVIACYNAPAVTSVSGTHGDIASILGRAMKHGIPTAPLNVSHGFHGPAMTATRKPLQQVLAGLAMTPTRRPVISTITGEELDSPPQDLRQLLVQQLTSPVLFSAAVTKLAKRCDVLIEAGPGTMLSNLVAENGVNVPALSMDCGGEPRRHAFVTAVLAAGGSARLHPWFENRSYRTLTLNHRPQFVVNPCETAPAGHTASQARVAADDWPRVDATRESAAVTNSPLESLVTHLAETVELPAQSITSSSSLLSDLHLSSLQAVQAIANVAAAMNKRSPDISFSLAEATIGQVAEMLQALPDADLQDQPPASVREWIRVLEPTWIPFTAGHAPPIAWSVVAPPQHWLHKLPVPEGKAAKGLALVIDRHSPAEIVDALRQIADDEPDQLLLIHSGHGAAAGVARSVAMEFPHCLVTAVDLPAVTNRIDPSTLTGDAASRYLELRATADGEFSRGAVRVRKLNTGAPSYLGAGDFCLVTGGVSGITAYAARALAERTQCSLLVVGRTPADDPQVRAALSELQATVDAQYATCDVADAAAVRALLANFENRDNIRGLLHGAGINEPRRLGEIDARSFERTLRAKVAGARTLLDSLGEDLNLAIGFGSIIGRQGLAGQAEYCIANDWLRVELERWAAAHPRCRTQYIEWSVWSQLGMGARLNVLDGLTRQGVIPLCPSEAVNVLLDVLDDPDAPTTVLVTSRFPATPTLSMTGASRSWLRFGERPRVFLPGIESISEADLSLGSDPYLADHRIDGVPVLPAVVGLEAMAQAAALAGSSGCGWSLQDVEFRSPVIVNDRGAKAIQIASLAEHNGVSVVLRDDSDRFDTDRFSARITRDPQPIEPIANASASRLKVNSMRPHPYYQSLFFHGPRFQRLIDYEMLSAFRISAWIRADAEVAWFSDFYGQELMLGDPGAHDATLHALLACLPHRRAIPVGVDRITFWRKPEGLLHVCAEETAHTADCFTFDVDVHDSAGLAVARWRGLRLRAIGSRQWCEPMPRRLLGPWLSRRLIDLDPAANVEIVVTDRGERDAADTMSPARITARPWADRTSDGQLFALADVPVAAEWMSVNGDMTTSFPVSLDGPDRHTVDVLTRNNEEGRTVTAARVHASRAALAKLDVEPDEAFRIGQVTDDALLVIHTDSADILTAKVLTADAVNPSVLAIATVAKGR